MSSEHKDEVQHITRRKFRSLLFHILYATDAFDYEVDPAEIAANFNQEYDVGIEIDGELVKAVREIAQNRIKLDEMFISHLQNWKFERIGKCTLLILRYAIWEMKYCPTPHSIVINEAIELAKCFAEKDSYKFINGMLDKVSTDCKQESESDQTTEEVDQDI